MAGAQSACREEERNELKRLTGPKSRRAMQAGTRSVDLRLRNRRPKYESATKLR